MIEQPEPDELVLTGRWQLDAGPARIFTLVTVPDALAEWWGPRGFTTPEVEQDLRMGGAYRYTMQPPEGDACLWRTAGSRPRSDSRCIATGGPTASRGCSKWSAPGPEARGISRNAELLKEAWIDSGWTRSEGAR